MVIKMISDGSPREVSTQGLVSHWELSIERLRKGSERGHYQILLLKYHFKRKWDSTFGIVVHHTDST